MNRLSILIAVGAVATSSAQAQDAASTPFLGTITGDNVYVRSGPSVDSSYPFGKLGRGNIVRVMENSHGWMRVRTEGDAFNGAFAYVPADRRVDVLADGKTIRATAVTEVRAPNINADASPDASWKQIGTLDPGETAVLLETIEGERDRLYKVQMPSDAEGWINVSFVRTATAEDIAMSQARNDAAATLAPAAGGDGSAVVAVPAPTVGDSTTIVLDEGPNEPGIGVEVSTVAVPDPAAAALAEAQARAAARRATLADLDGVWNTVKGQRGDDSEMDTLRSRYLALADESRSDMTVAGKAKHRAEQLRLQIEVSSRMREVGAARAQLSSDAEVLAGIARALEARSDYTAVGVLNASMVYDGKRLPLLYRLQDAGTGQAVAYLVPGDDFQLSTMLGNLLGVKGKVEFDEALRVNILSARSIDLLTAKPDAATAAAPVEVIVEEATEEVLDDGSLPCPEEEQEATPEPAATEPAAEPAAAPAAAPSPAPAVEPTPAPAAEPAPTPSSEPEPEKP